MTKSYNYDTSLYYFQIVLRNSLDPDLDWDFWPDRGSMNMDLKHCLKVHIVIIHSDAVLELAVDAENKVDVEALVDNRERKDQQVHPVPGAGQVGAFQAHHLHHLLQDVVEGENDEHDLTAQKEVVIARKKGNEFDRVDDCSREDPACSRKLKEQGDNREEIDVGIVDSEVEEDSSGAPVNPEGFFQLFQDGPCITFVLGQVLHISIPTVIAKLKEKHLFYYKMNCPEIAIVIF